ncbi:hypothetical protein [Bradyrhizobium sp. Cp5.3]|uniref:hypothetical protein n=1 Tax=Bradyrhizobium sp. Cp5.3 TaxID=443598 RepID=UPI0004030F50|nr:hypothetical protein [Bradyrhizobium sp. Cp5.3]
MTTSALNVAEASLVLEQPAPRRRLRAATIVAALFGLLAVTAIPLSEGFSVGGRAAVGQKLSTVGARVEDFVPEDRSKLSKPIIGGLIAGAASTVGKRVAGALVDVSWPVAQAWFDRKTHKTDQMIWAGPLHIVNGKPDGRDDTVTTLKFDGDGNLALAYRLARFSAIMGFDVGKFKMSATATMVDGDCSCTYRSYGPEVEIWTTGVVQQTWRSEKNHRIYSVVAAMDSNGQLASGQVTASFGGVTMTRPAVFGSPHDKLNADKRLDNY